MESFKNILLNMDDKLTEVEIAIEKGKFQSVQLMDSLTTRKTEFQKVYSWDDCRIMSEIVLDYIAKTEEKLKAVRETFDILWNQDTKENPKKNMDLSGGCKQ